MILGDHQARRNAEAVIATLDWIDTPYRHQASTKGQGADCLGLVRGVYRELVGAEVEALPPYGRRPTSKDEALLVGAARYLQPAQAVGAGSVLLFRMRRSLPISHCGIAIAADRFVHAYDGHAVVSSTLSEFWRSRIAAIFRFPEPL